MICLIVSYEIGLHFHFIIIFTLVIAWFKREWIYATADLYSDILLKRPHYDKEQENEWLDIKAAEVPFNPEVSDEEKEEE